MLPALDEEGAGLLVLVEVLRAKAVPRIQVEEGWRNLGSHLTRSPSVEWSSLRPESLATSRHAGATHTHCTQVDASLLIGQLGGNVLLDGAVFGHQIPCAEVDRQEKDACSKPHTGQQALSRAVLLAGLFKIHLSVGLPE